MARFSVSIWDTLPCPVRIRAGWHSSDHHLHGWRVPDLLNVDGVTLLIEVSHYLDIFPAYSRAAAEASSLYSRSPARNTYPPFSLDTLPIKGQDLVRLEWPPDEGVPLLPRVPTGQRQ